MEQLHISGALTADAEIVRQLLMGQFGVNKGQTWLCVTAALRTALPVPAGEFMHDLLYGSRYCHAAHVLDVLSLR
jgi:hypothetical protein